MVDGWLKRRLITDFFALLSEDGSADQRRLNYWLRFVPIIDGMWFALGSHARYADTSEFREMRKRMEGQLHFLREQGSPFNNAFLMKIGIYLVVEFGVTGNATYIFHAEESRIDFSQRELSMSRLKGNGYIARLIHRAYWESNFDYWLCPRLGWWPGQQVAQVPEALPRQKITTPSCTDTGLHTFIDAHHLSHHDFRERGGAFWIDAPDKDDVISPQLIAWGFEYSVKKHWWWRE